MFRDALRSWKVRHPEEKGFWERWGGRKAGVGRENLVQTSPEWEITHPAHTGALHTHAQIHL